MKKTVVKTICTLGVALSVFMCNSTFSFAAVCSGAPDGVHHFDSHSEEGSGYEQDGGHHGHLYGYDSQGKPLFRDCVITYEYKYCSYTCKYCGTKQSGSRHDHLVGTKHSVN